jgi:tRNA threonylcarbamoyladenosine biosynthesis protein TsaB
MRVLAFDTASPAPALALLLPAPGNATRVETEELGTAAAESLPARLETLLSRSGVRLGQIGRIAVLSGPGSFTGLRAGTAFARGLARALAVPLVWASTFRAAAATLPTGDADLLLDAGRGEVHRARLRGGELSEENRPVTRETAVRDAAREGVAAIPLDEVKPGLAAALARLAASEGEAGEPLALLYGRPSAAEERWGSG